MIEAISPKRARLLFESGSDYRQPDQAVIDRLAAKMIAGTFEPTPGIIIGTTGRLHDGQHRLLAIMRTGLTVQLEITRWT